MYNYHFGLSDIKISAEKLALVFDNPNQLKTYVWCLLKLSERPHQVPEENFLNAGEFRAQRSDGMRELGIKSQTFYKTLKKLESLGLIEMQKDTIWKMCYLITVKDITVI